MTLRPESRAIIAALVSSRATDTDERIRELTRVLAQRGIDVVAHVIQRRGVSRSSSHGGVKRLDAPLSAAMFLGKGKAEELARLAKAHAVDVVYVLNALSSTQVQRLSAMAGCQVMSCPDLRELGAKEG